jgi:arginase
MLSFKRIVPILVECDVGQKKYGVNFGGKFLYQAMMRDNYPLEEPRVIHQREFNNFNHGMKRIKEETHKVLREKNFPLVLGGDHSISYGSLKGVLEYYRNNIHVLWIDSHTDINTYESSTTKSRHGMPLSSLMGFNNEDWGMDNNKHILRPEQLTYFGINSIDDFEMKKIKELNISYIHRDDLLTKLTRDFIPEGVPIHISFDVDVLDKELVPCTGTPVDRGFEPELIDVVIRNLKGQVVSMDIVEYNPFLGNVNENEMSLYSILCATQGFFKNTNL